MKKINKKYIEFGLFIGLAIIIVCPILFGAFYIMHLEEQLIERDNLIRELTFRSNLVEEYFDIKQDSLGNTISYVLKDSKAIHITTTREVIREVDNTPVITQGDSIVSIDKMIYSHNQLIQDYNALYDKQLSLRSDLKKKESVLELIEKRYQITYTEERDSCFIVLKLINTEKVDSALLLLPVYRQRLYKVDDKWVIRR